jgi:hypothetical protein
MHGQNFPALPRQGRAEPFDPIAVMQDEADSIRLLG